MLPKVLIVLLASFCAYADGKTDYQIDRVENGSVFVRVGAASPKEIKTGLWDIKAIGFLRDAELNATYIVATAKPCKDCQLERKVHLIRIENNEIHAFVHPGRVIDPKTRQSLFDARGFFGRCLPQNQEVYVLFQKERIDRRRSPQLSVFVAKPGRHFLEEKLYERGLPSINFSQKRVKLKQCTEIDGINRMMMTKLVDLTPRLNDDDNDNDDETKENQTSEELKPAAD